MKQINSYKDLTVWQKSMDLVTEIYNLTEKFPKSETYGLVSQMQRSAVAIPSNIAEGQKEIILKSFYNFYILVMVQELNWKLNWRFVKDFPN